MTSNQQHLTWLSKFPLLLCKKEKKEGDLVTVLFLPSWQLSVHPLGERDEIEEGGTDTYFIMKIYPEVTKKTFVNFPPE